MKRRRTETSFSPFFLLFFDHKNAESSALRLPISSIFSFPHRRISCLENNSRWRRLSSGSCGFSVTRQRKAQGIRSGAGNAAKKPIGIVPHLQRIENIQKVLLQRIELIEKGKPDQHIAVNNVARIIGFIAASVAGNRAERKARHIGAGPLRVLVNVDHTVLQTVIAAVIKIEIQPLSLKKRAPLQRPHRGRRGRRKGRLIAGQLPEGNLQRLTDLI